MVIRAADTEEQQLFARLSVFAGGCTLEAAEEVADADLDSLQSLVEKSLLRFTTGRYWMLETIREYAAERLEKAGENEGYEERHAAFFLALAERLEPPPIGSGADEGWVPLLVVETDNIRMAVEFLSARPEPSGELRLVGSLFRFWEVVGLASEGRRSSEHALERSAGADQHLRMKVLYAAFLCAFNQGDVAVAQMYEEERLAVARAVGDKGAVAVALNDLGILAEAAGDYDASVSHYDASAALASELGDGITLLAVGINRGYGALVQGDYGRARRLLEDALEIAIRLGDVHGRAMVLGNLGFALCELGEPRRAALQFCEALELSLPVAGPRANSYILDGLAAVAISERDATRAARLSGFADALRGESGSGAESFERTVVDRTERAGRASLDDERWEVEYARGAAMSLDDAAAYAREVCDG